LVWRQLPFAAERLPAWDIGPPYLARFSAVSGIGPLVVVVTVAAAPVEGSLVVTDVEVAAPVAAAGSAGAGAVDGAGLADESAGKVGSGAGVVAGAAGAAAGGSVA
jgi:hypothetical protein